MATVVDAGLVAVAKMINGVDSIAPFIYMATGSSSTAEAYGQTALVSENTLYGSARAEATCSYEATGISKWVHLFTFSGTVTIREIAIINAVSGGIMLIRHVLVNDKVYGDGESVEITFTTTTARV
jgi:hypothetical protein